MRKMTVIIMVAMVMLFAGIALADGDAVRGKELYSDPAFGGSTNDLSCDSCHPGGKGIEHAGARQYTSLMGQPAESLEDVVNICIERPMAGKAMDKDSPDMQDIVAYIRSLGK